MKYLVETTEVYRVDSEPEVVLLIDEAKKDSKFMLSKYDCIKKERIQKGEIVDSWYKVSLKKRFNDEKEPDDSIVINYSKGG